MSTAGYSGTPLVKKLGIKPGARMYVDGAPAHYFDLLGPLPADVVISTRLNGEFDFLHVFADQAKQLKQRLRKLKPRLKPDGMLWISWPKGTSPLAKDLNGGDVRELGLAAGLVDIKVCAVDQDWSGHKFVIPVADRPKTMRKTATQKATAKTAAKKMPAGKKATKKKAARRKS